MPPRSTPFLRGSGPPPHTTLRGGHVAHQARLATRSESPGEFPFLLASTPLESSTFEVDDDDRPPAVLVSPIKRRMRQDATTIYTKPDVEVWELTDEEIVGAAVKVWNAPVYEHYTTTLKRHYDSDGNPLKLAYAFTCTMRPEIHKVQHRDRMNTKAGTGNLNKTMQKCLLDQGLPIPGRGTAAGATTSDASVIPYTEAGHRALIALRCSKSLRPFNFVSDEDYHLELKMLRQDVVLISPSKVSRDVNLLYLEMSKHVRRYFEQHNIKTVHLVMDGWTSPIKHSYLGIVVVWAENGEIHRAILDFIRLTHRHDGQYLAKVVAECLSRFEIAEKLFTICMDNATNCDKLAVVLPQHISGFGGASSRLCCLAHVFNLIAKASMNDTLPIFISFFFKKPHARKAIGVAGGAVNARFRRPGESNDLGDEEEIVFDGGDDISDDDEEENAAAIEEDDAEIEAIEADGDDEGQGAHNERVCKTLRDKAIYLMEKKKIKISAAQERMALQIFPRVAGLARRVHDSTDAQQRFSELVERDPDVQGTQRTLSRRVPTRWNSDLNCLLSHFYFRNVVEELTSSPAAKLTRYRLTEAQWEMAEDVKEVLLLLDDVTKIFSTANVPLIIDVIPTLEDIREGMIAARDDTVNEVSPVIRTACQASILLIDKYSTFAEDCDIYLFAIVFCPDRKFKWFKDHGRNARQIKEIQTRLIAQWEDRYAPVSSDSDSESEESEVVQVTQRSRYAKARAEDTSEIDSIKMYMEEPIVPSSAIQNAGGYIKFWHAEYSSRPYLSQMALDYCSAPATSVDAERAFSTGRRQINFMQTNMNSQTFRAQMAVGSWAKSPLYPGFDFVRDVIADKVANENPFLVEK